MTRTLLVSFFMSKIVKSLANGLLFCFTTISFNKLAHDSMCKIVHQTGFILVYIFMVLYLLQFTWGCRHKFKWCVQVTRWRGSWTSSFENENSGLRNTQKQIGETLIKLWESENITSLSLDQSNKWIWIRHTDIVLPAFVHATRL